MDVGFRKCFIKQFKKFSQKIQEHFSERLELFIKDPFNPVLNNHQLNGEMKNMRSINVTGDIRAIYEQIDKNKVLFLEIGKHSELYN